MKEKKKVKFIPCNEFEQIYNWQRTMKRNSFMQNQTAPKVVISQKDLKEKQKKRSAFVRKWAKKNLKLKS